MYKRKLKAAVKKALISLGVWKPLEYYPTYKSAEALIASAARMVDIGSGAHPHPKAAVAVDKFLTPDHRLFGKGAQIEVESIEKQGVQFVCAGIESMPFADKEFDVAYSHHVLEHVDDPIVACREVMRIATKGVIYTPSAFSEIAFGRPYHKWLMHAKGRTLVFIEKHPDENQPFSFGKENPFDIALNEGRWYWKPILIKNLRKKIQEYWRSHHPALECVFLWENTFDVLVCRLSGKIECMTFDCD